MCARAKEEALDNVIFCPPVNKEKLAELMSAADLGLQLLANVPAFYFGTSPNKFFDYIAAGLPVLNNYPGWLSQMIEEHNCGYTVPPDDPERFADILSTAADERSALVQMGLNAQRLAEEKFHRYRLAERWVNWLEECCNETNF